MNEGTKENLTKTIYFLPISRRLNSSRLRYTTRDLIYTIVFEYFKVETPFQATTSVSILQSFALMF